MILCEESEQLVSQSKILGLPDNIYRVKQSSILLESSMYPSIVRGRVTRLSDPFLVGGLDSNVGEREFEPSVLADGSEYVPEACSCGL